MKSELLARSPLLLLPLCALFLFIGVFTVMLVMTMRRRSAAYDPVARLPLADDPPLASARENTRDQSQKGGEP